MTQVSTLTTWTAMASVSWSSTCGGGQSGAEHCSWQRPAVRGVQGQERVPQGRQLSGLGALGARQPHMA